MEDEIEGKRAVSKDRFVLRNKWGRRDSIMEKLNDIVGVDVLLELVNFVFVLLFRVTLVIFSFVLEGFFIVVS